MIDMIETEVVLDIRNPKEREQYFFKLYEENIPAVAKFVAHRGGSFRMRKISSRIRSSFLWMSAEKKLTIKYRTISILSGLQKLMDPKI